MKRYFFVFFIATTFLGLNSCNDDDNDIVSYHFEKLKTVKVDLPDSFDFGSRYEIVVTYDRPNNCTYFQDFDVYAEGTTSRNVTPIGIVYSDVDCTAETTEVTDSFLFEVIYEQPYTFHFWQGEDANGQPQYLDVTVPVN